MAPEEKNLEERSICTMKREKSQNPTRAKDLTLRVATSVRNYRNKKRQLKKKTLTKKMHAYKHIYINKYIHIYIYTDLP